MKTLLLSFVVFSVFISSFGLPTQQSLTRKEGNRNNLIENGYREISEVLEDVSEGKSEDKTERSSSYDSTTNKSEADFSEVDTIILSTTTKEASKEEVTRIESGTTESVSTELTTETTEISEDRFEVNEHKSVESSKEVSEEVRETSSEQSEEKEFVNSILQQVDITANLVKLENENISKETIGEEQSGMVDNTSTNQGSSLIYNVGINNRFGVANQYLETTTYSDLTSITTSNSDGASVTSEESSDRSPSTISNSNFDETTTAFSTTTFQSYNIYDSATTSQTNKLHDSVSASTEGSSVSIDNAWTEPGKVITIGGRINIKTDNISPSTTNNIIDSNDKDSTTNIPSVDSYKDAVTIGKTTVGESFKNDKDTIRTTTKSSVTIIYEPPTSTEANVISGSSRSFDLNGANQYDTTKSSVTIIYEPPTSTEANVISGSSRSFDLNGANQYDLFSGIKTTTPSDAVTEIPKVSFIDTSLAQGIVGTQPTTSLVEIHNRLGVEETTTVKGQEVSLAADILPPILNSESKSETSTDNGLVQAVFTGEVILDDPITDIVPRKGFFFNFQSLGAYNLASLTRNSYSNFGSTTPPISQEKKKTPQRISNKKNGEHMPEFSLGIINKYTGSDLQIDTVNLGKTGSINRLDGGKSMLFKGFHIHQPTYGKYL